MATAPGSDTCTGGSKSSDERISKERKGGVAGEEKRRERAAHKLAQALEADERNDVSLEDRRWQVVLLPGTSTLCRYPPVLPAVSHIICSPTSSTAVLLPGPQGALTSCPLQCFGVQTECSYILIPRSDLL